MEERLYSVDFNAGESLDSEKVRKRRWKSSKPILTVLTLTLFLTLTGSGVEGTLSVMSESTNETVFSTEEAAIDTSSAYGLTGHLVISSPLDACTTVNPPPSDGRKGYHLLLATAHISATEDRCSFAKKAKNAQAAGYVGIIMRRLGSNDTSGLFPYFIGLDWMGVKIYACVVGDDIGGFIMDRFAYPNKYVAKFENEPYYPIGLLTNFFVIGFLIIVLFLILLRLFHYCYFRVTTRVVERRRIKRTLLSEAQLRKLPVLKWTSSIPQDTCSICIDQFEENADIRVLPCSHVFHKDCIDPWLLKESRKCPNCKGRVLFPNERKKYGHSSDSDEESESANERTPLLRPRENFRYIETLTESHNSRALNHQYQYLQEDEDEEVPSPRKSVPKVTFAPAVSVMSSTSSSASSGATAIGRPAIANAFVLPMAPKPGKKSSLKSPLKRLVVRDPALPQQGSSGTGGNYSGAGASDSDTNPNPGVSGPGSTSSDDTLIDFYDIPGPSQDSQHLHAGSTPSLQSFHSCQEFDSEFPSLEGYGSFQSLNDSTSSSP